ncbi:MAG: glutamine-synthetase adenylyltransferase, partial [Sphingomonadales bacterium]|nr:glutamine-synthetase adenylyltransferase [Sphingomonadales bacterium]
MTDAFPRRTISDALAAAERESDFLANLIRRETETVSRIDRLLDDPLVLLDDVAGEPPARGLRLARRRLALVVAIGDLSGRYDLTRTTQTLSDFADRVLDRAIRVAVAERVPGAAADGFAAIALGKQGSRELNYSSDIDPILIFDPSTLAHRDRDEVDDAAV